MDKRLKDLQERVAALDEVCAEMYQVAGAIGAPVRVLDQLWAVAEGKALPHDSILPFDASECRPVPSVADAIIGEKIASSPRGRRRRRAR